MDCCDVTGGVGSGEVEGRKGKTADKYRLRKRNPVRETGWIRFDFTLFLFAAHWARPSLPFLPRGESRESQLLTNSST